jgi:mRNA interferase MazF
MITRAENRGWPSDGPIANLALAGLPAPSVVRPSKIATIDATRAQRLGALSQSQLHRVMRVVAETLSLRAMRG